MKTSIECTALNITVNGLPLVRELNLQLAPGAFVCILGPNGVGKTLTLHTLAGLRPEDDGEIRLQGDSMHELDRPDIARRLGLLLQAQDDAFPATVLETALMGRHSRLGFWQWEGRNDIEIARTALREMDIVGLDQRTTATLSGGERRRVALATLLVQDPEILLLDEPMNHLDPLHKLQVLTKLSQLAAQGKTIVASLHDPMLAARFADAALLLYGGGHWEYGPTGEMLMANKLERLYGTPFETFTHNGHQVLLPMLATVDA